MPTSIKRFFSLNCDSFRKQSIELEKNSCPKNCLLIMRKYKEKQQKCIFLFDNKPLLIVQTVFHTVVYLARSIYQKCFTFHGSSGTVRRSFVSFALILSTIIRNGAVLFLGSTFQPGWTPCLFGLTR